MKSIIVICIMGLCFLIGGCSSEKKQEKMWDTSVAADSDFINLDTGNASNTSVDTTKKDTTKVNQ
ncbi:hypothetical protein D3C87_352890 [compost metagenome]